MTQLSAVEFRVAKPADALCIGVLATQVFLDTYATDGLRPDLAREAVANYSPAVFEARIRDSANHFLLAERAGHLVAFSECSLSSKPPIPSLSGGVELVRLYVQRLSQRVGIGAALLARTEVHAKEARAPSCGSLPGSATAMLVPSTWRRATKTLVRPATCSRNRSTRIASIARCSRMRPNPSIERTCPGKPGHASRLKR